MELSPSWEAVSCAATQELPSFLWNPKINFRVHKSPPLVPFLSQISPIHTILSYLFKSILMLSTHLRLGLPSGLFPSGIWLDIVFVKLSAYVVDKYEIGKLLDHDQTSYRSSIVMTEREEISGTLVWNSTLTPPKDFSILSVKASNITKCEFLNVASSVVTLLVWIPNVTDYAVWVWRDRQLTYGANC
jgi:hypothetical protein